MAPEDGISKEAILGGTKAQMFLDFLKAAFWQLSKGLFLIRIDTDINCFYQLSIGPGLESVGAMTIDFDVPVAMLGPA